MLLVFSLVARADPLEAVVFPGSGVDRADVEARLAALRVLDPPPSSVVTIGARLRVDVAPDQVVQLTDAGWDPIAEQPVRDVAEADAIVSAAWAAIPTATVLVEIIERDVTTPVRLASSEGAAVVPGRVPAGTYRVVVGDLVLQPFRAEPGAVVRVQCSLVFRNCHVTQ